MSTIDLDTRAPRPRERVRDERLAQRPEGAPTVSVVIPCYNYGRYLPQAVASALDQRDVTVEVIVVDDASTDDSSAVAAALAAADPRVRAIRNERNLGMVGTFNNGLAESTGEFLVRLDADDLLTPGSLARATALARAFPEVGLVYGHPVHFETPQPPAHRDRATFWDILDGPGWVELRCRRGVNCVTSPEVLMRSSVVDEVGGQRPLGHTPDMEMWMRIARASAVGWVGGADQAFHREHPDSMSATGLDVLTDLTERRDAFEILLTDGLGQPDWNARMLGIAHAALADEAIARTVSAYVRGRGGSEETDAYLDFADSLGIDLGVLPHAAALRTALRLGPRRSRRSPSLVLTAARYRLARETGGRQWRTRGL